MAEQDHKLTSMVSLVSILAQDLRLVKSNLASLEQYTNDIQYSTKLNGGLDLISVSDGGDEEEDENDNTTNEEVSYASVEDDIDDEEEDDDIEDDIDDEEEDDDIDDEEEDDDIDDEDAEIKVSPEHIKLLNLTLANDDVKYNYPIEELNCNFEEPVNHHNDDIKTIHLENSINFEETHQNPLKPEQTDVNVNINISGEDISFLKNISITDLGEADDLHASKSEYKKMSLIKLREVVISKGVVADASKLKKNEILKMLGDE